jgi:hypothetical protein
MSRSIGRYQTDCRWQVLRRFLIATPRQVRARFPLSQRKLENLLFERVIDNCHETVHVLVEQDWAHIRQRVARIVAQMLERSVTKPKAAGPSQTNCTVTCQS